MCFNKKNFHVIFIITGALFYLSGCYVATKQAGYADTSIMWAIKNGDIKKVKNLLEDSPDINERHSVTGETPLIYATKKNNAVIVSLLISHSADKNIRDNMGNSALDWASRNGNSDIIAILLKKNISGEARQKNVTSLVSAVYAGNLDTVKYLIKSGLPVNSHDSYGDTPFMAATKTGNTEIMSYLLKQGADIYATDKLGRSALMLSSQTGYIEIVADLIKKGSDINSKSSKGFTALMFASANAQAGVVKILLDQGAKLNLRDKEGNSTIFLAAANKRWFVLEMLLDAGTDLSLEPVGDIHKTPSVVAPMYGIAGEYYLNKSNREKAIKYFSLSKKSYINLAKKYKDQADDEAMSEIYSFIGKSLLLAAVAVGEDRNSRIQARQQAKLGALSNKPESYVKYNKRASSGYHKYYKLNKLAVTRAQQYSDWAVSSNPSGQTAGKKLQVYTRLSVWAEKKANKIGLTLSCVRKSGKGNIKTCNY